MKTHPILLGLALLAALALPVCAQTKIGIVDLRKVFDEYHKTKSADSLLKDKAEGMEKERKSLMESYQKIGEEYKKSVDGASDQAVSADEREKRKKTAESKLIELNGLRQDIENFNRQAETTLKEQQRRMRDNILAEIRSVVNAKAKAGGYSLVLDSAAESINQTPVVIDNNGENDLTAAVLDQLNVGERTTPAPPKPGNGK